jgi:hypothetical protein
LRPRFTKVSVSGTAGKSNTLSVTRKKENVIWIDQSSYVARRHSGEHSPVPFPIDAKLL